MALTNPKPAPDSLEALKAGLEDAGGPESGSQDWLSLYDDSEEQHRFHVYILGLGSIVRRRTPLDAAQPRGWRFFWKHPSNGPIVCEVSRAKKDSRPVMTGHWNINDREAGQALVALKRLERSAAKEGAFELRMLNIPGLQIECLWLKSQDQQHPDKLVPILSLYPEIKPMKEYLAKDFFGAAKRLAERRLASHGV